MFMNNEEYKTWVENWLANNPLDPAAIEKAALEHEKSRLDELNSKCHHCGAIKSPDDYQVLDAQTVDRWFYGFWKRRKDGLLRINVCKECGYRGLYWYFEPEKVRFKTRIESPIDEISAFVERVNKEVVNSRAHPFDLLDDLPHEAIPHIKADYMHLMGVPLEVIYYYAHLNHAKIEYSEEIFQEEYLADPDGAYKGRFKPELEEVLLREFVSGGCQEK